MDTTWINVALSAAGGSLIAFLADRFIGPYISKKAENQATKEDIKEITNKIESVRAAIGSRLHVSQFRYEKEFEILSKLTAIAVDLRDVSRGIRPIADTCDSDRPEVKQARIEKYHQAAQRFYDTVEKNRPFYDETVYALATDLEKSCFKEAISSRRPSERDNNYWNEAEKHFKEISELAEKLITIIRKRVQVWEKENWGSGGETP